MIAWVVAAFSVAMALGALVLWVVAREPLVALSFPDPGIGLAFPLVGALIATRRPRNPVGWVMLLVGAFGALTLAGGVYGYAALVSRPSLPGEDWGNWVANWAWAPTFLLLVTVLIPIFPQGHVASRWWRPVVGASGVVVAMSCLSGALVPSIQTGVPGRTVPNPLPISAAAAEPIQVLSVFVGLGLMVVCVVGLVRRFRASTGVLRLQLSWFTYGFAIGLVFMVLNVLGSGSDRHEPPLAIAFGLIASAGFAFAAVGVGVAVFRYRLYDIDRVINRTIVYSLLTTVLVGLYAAIVVGIGTAIGRRTSPVLIAAATLIVAAAAGPARRRIQELIDRRFYRRRYDAEQTLAEFGARLRDEVDVDELRRLLRRTADQTVQPERVAIWIRGVDS
jgi:hypothetical protein